jgi:hypothetical protein
MTPQGAARKSLEQRIERAIEPFDIAGLLHPQRRSWYPVLAEDLLRSASKLRATEDEIRRLLERTGMVTLTTPSAPPTVLP